MSVKSEQKCFDKVSEIEAQLDLTLGKMTLKTHK